MTVRTMAAAMVAIEAVVGTMTMAMAMVGQQSRHYHSNCIALLYDL